MPAQMPDLQSFFASLARSPGMGMGPSAAGRPSPGPVQPSAAGEGIRGLWSNSGAPGAMLSQLFNKESFPQLAPNTPSPFPPSATLPRPQPQFPTDRPAQPSRTPAMPVPVPTPQAETPKEETVGEREARMYPAKPSWMTVERWLNGPDK